MLNEDAAAVTESVTVMADPYETAQSNAASEQTLNKRELQALSSVLLGDPIRAAQALPGSTANDDLHDNFFVNPDVGRYPGLQEDEPPILRLISEKPA